MHRKGRQGKGCVREPGVDAFERRRVHEESARPLSLTQTKWRSAQFFFGGRRSKRLPIAQQRGGNDRKRTLPDRRQDEFSVPADSNQSMGGVSGGFLAALILIAAQAHKFIGRMFAFVLVG